jgi:cytochrome P450
MSVAPPRHTKFREAVQPLFMNAALEPKADSFEVLAARLISGITERGGDISTELALLYVIGCLTIVSNPPRDYPAGPDERRPSRTRTEP